MQTPLISVIVPVYNSEKYLPRCVDSLLVQTYSNIEIILVNDGSKDGSGAICDQYAQRDCRVKVLHKPNGGVSSARNAGLDYMSGQYCAFVDSDDCVSPFLLQRLMDACTQTGAKLAVCDWQQIPNGKQIQQETGTSDSTCVQSIDTKNGYRYTAEYAHASACAALYARENVKDVRFDIDLYIGEDALFFAKNLKKVERMAYLPMPLYYYVIYQQSANHGNYTRKRATEITAWNRIIAEFENYPESFLQECRARLGTAYYAGLRCMLESDNTSEATPQAYHEKLKELRGEVMKSALPVSYKAGYTLMCLSPKTYMHIFRRMRH